MPPLTEKTIPQAFQRAQALARAGRAPEAMAIYTEILMLRPKTPEVHFQIGRLHAAAGRREKAVASFATAVLQRPGETAIWQALLAVATGAALDPVLEAVAASPTADQMKQGAALWSLRHPALAEPLLRAAADAGEAKALRPLAQLLAETARPEEAEPLLDRAAGKTAEDWMALARLRAVLRRPGQARSALREAVGSGARELHAISELADKLAQENETAAAEAMVSGAIRRAPDASGLYVQRAQMLQSLGELARAEADLARAMALDPGNGEAFRAYTAGRKMQSDDPAIAAMDRALARTDLRPGDRWRFHFAMAKTLSDVGRDSEVFGHLNAANGLQRAAAPYDFETQVGNARRMLAAFRRHLAGRAPDGPEDRAIFVTGLPRSGTTLVESVFAAHSTVTAGGELTFLGEALAPVMDALALDRAPAPEDLAAAGRRYVAMARRRTGAEAAFTDKAIGTFTRIGHALTALPGARVFVLDRDPRDVGLSLYRNMFREGQHRFSTDLRDIGRYIRLVEALVTAWEDLFPGQVHRIDYDALTADPETGIRALIAAADLSWEEACLHPHEADRRVGTLSFAQVRQPIYRSSVAAWRRFEADLGPLFEGLDTSVDLG